MPGGVSAMRLRACPSGFREDNMREGCRVLKYEEEWRR